MAAMNENESFALILANEVFDKDDSFGILVEQIKSLREEEEVICSLLHLLLEKRNKNIRIPSYYELVIPQYTPSMFKRHFRMSLSSVEKLSMLIYEKCSNLFEKRNQGGRPMIDLNKLTCIFLWYISSKEKIRSISDRFDITESSVQRVIVRVGTGLKELSPHLIFWPTGTRFHQVREGFRKFRGLDCCIGAIDGTHVPIKGPTFCGENYVNRKGFHSLILQGVVDHEYRFTDCYTGWPGSVHDARVFSNSDLGITINDSPMDKFPGGTFIIGDAAYPLSAHLLTPYKDNGYLSEIQKSYNFKHSSTRNVVERAFAILKSRFSRSKHVEMNKLEDICLIILSACVLHNYCLDEGMDMEDIDIEQQEEVNSFACIGSSKADASAKRDTIANELM